MNTSAPLDDRWRTPLILTIGYVIASVGLAPAIFIAAGLSNDAALRRAIVAGLMIAIGAGLVAWLWRNAGRQRRHNPTTWKPVLAGIAVTAVVALVILGHAALAASDLAALHLT